MDKRTMTKKSDRERIARELEEACEYHKTEVAFLMANPPHDPVMGQRLVQRFLVMLAENIEWMEKNYFLPGNECAPHPHRGMMEDLPPYYEIQSYFTPEQTAELAAINARADHLELVSKAKNYDELLDTLERCGLCPDKMPNEDGTLIGIIAVENRALATEWFRDAVAHDDESDAP
jgi:hypothetical protein